MTGSAALRRGLATALTAFLAGEAAASAQDARATRSIFGPPGSRAGSDSSVTLFLGEAYDTQPGVEAGGPPGRTAEAGSFSTIGADLALRVGRSARSLLLTAGTGFRYYHELGETVGLGHYAGFGLTLGSRRTTLTVNQSVAYTPAYLFRMFPSASPPEPGGVTVGSNYVGSDDRSYNYVTRAALSRTISKRSTLSFHASGGYADFVSSNPSQVDTWNMDVGGAFVRQLSAHTRIRTGYALRRYRVIGARPVEHGVDVGIDVDRPASPTCGTRLSISAGTSVLHDAPSMLTAGALASQTRLTAEASLVRQFSRTWELRGVYRRGLNYLDGFAAAMMGDGISVSSEGLLGPRSDLSVLAAYSRSEPTTPLNPGDRLTTYMGSARLRLAVTTTLALYGEYFYYQYELPSQMLVFAGGASRLERNGVRAGLQAWIPLRRR